MIAVAAVERCRMQLPVLKVRPGSVTECVFWDVGPIWFGVHWVGDRQHLCCAEDSEPCPLCSAVGGRVVGLCLVGCRLQGGERAFLLEVSPLAWSQFEARLRFAGLDLDRGVLASISRSRARGVMHIEPMDGEASGAVWLDAERRLVGAWAVLYGLPLPYLVESFEDFHTRLRPLIASRAEIALSKLRK